MPECCENLQIEKYCCVLLRGKRGSVVCWSRSTNHDLILWVKYWKNGAGASERDLWPCACAIKINFHKNADIFIQQNVSAFDECIYVCIRAGRFYYYTTLLSAYGFRGSRISVNLCILPYLISPFTLAYWGHLLSPILCLLWHRLAFSISRGWKLRRSLFYAFHIFILHW